MDLIHKKGGKTHMTKQEYLAQLKQALSTYSPSFQQEILDAFESHFQEGLAQGRSEEEIMNDLGTIDDVLENIHMMGGEKAQTSHNKDDYETLKNGLDSAFNAFTSIANKALDQVKDYVSTNKKSDKDTPYYYGTSETKTIEDTSIVAVYLRLHPTVKLFSSLDIEIQSGESLSYTFTPAKTIFSRQGNQDVLVSIDGTTATIEICSAGKLALVLPLHIKALKTQLSIGDMNIDNIALEEFHCENKTGDIDISNSDIIHAYFDMNAGDIDVDDSNFQDITLHMSAGDIDFNNTAGNLQAKLTAGDINIDHHAGENISILATAGDIDLDLVGHIQNLEINATAGDIDVTTDNTDYTATISSKLGDIHFDHALPYQTLDRNSYLIGNGSGKIFIQAKAGDISLD